MIDQVDRQAAASRETTTLMADRLIAGDLDLQTMPVTIAGNLDPRTMPVAIAGEVDLQTVPVTGHRIQDAESALRRPPLEASRLAIRPGTQSSNRPAIKIPTWAFEDSPTLENNPSRPKDYSKSSRMRVAKSISCSSSRKQAKATA